MIDLRNGVVTEYLGHTEAVYDVSFCPNNRLASCSKDGSIKLWDLSHQESTTFNVPQLRTATHCLTLASHAGEAHLFSGTGTGAVAQWRFDSQDVLQLRSLTQGEM